MVPCEHLSLSGGLLRGGGILEAPGTKCSFHTKGKLPFLPARMVKVHIPTLSLSESHDVDTIMELLGITPVFNKKANSSVIMEQTPQKSFKVRSPHSAVPEFV